MPQGDRTGSQGQGPGTGRMFGYCYGFDSPGYIKGAGGRMRRGIGYGRGMGRGRNFGHGIGFSAFKSGFVPGYPWMHPMSKDDEIKLLKSQADALRRSQKDIENRLGELEKEKE
jgi:Family of unknown function (DUF5320)